MVDKNPRKFSIGRKAVGNIYFNTKISRKIGRTYINDFLAQKKILKKRYKFVEKTALSKTDKATVAWFLDNFRFIDESLDYLEGALNPRFFDRLPLMGSGSNQNLRIEKLCEDIFKVHGAVLSENKIIKYFQDTQSGSKLTLSELWFAPIMLQYKTLQMISASITTGSKAETEKEISNSILTLISLQKINWRNFVEKTSHLENVLKKDPAGVYPNMDFETRDIYRHTIENLAKKSSLDEIQITEEALAKAQAAKLNDLPKNQQHIGYHIFTQNNDIPQNILGYQHSLIEKFRTLLRKNNGLYYIALMLIISSLLATAINLLATSSFEPLLFLLLMMVCLPATEILINRILIKFFPPKNIYKMSPDVEVAPNAKTLVVVATLLGKDPLAPQQLVDDLFLNYMAGRDKNIYYGLILSFEETKDREDKPTKEQQTNLDLVREKIRNLNKEYGEGQDKFMLFFRSRSWDDCERLCLEKERKRGKILDLVDLLRSNNGNSISIVDAPMDLLKKIKYIITLDNGEKLPKGAARKLVSAMEHPLNEPQIDKESNTVTSGFGIIQPQMVSFYKDTHSLFTRLFMGGTWDSYDTLSSSIYQDMFGESTYFGKGIFNVDTFSTVLDGRIADNTLLSHDLIEGFYCRTALASDIQAFEDGPEGYGSFMKRRERWTRGDWQNIFWLFSKTKTQRGTPEDNPFPLFKRWIIFTNIQRTLLYPSAAFLTIIATLSQTKSSLGVLAIFTLVAINTGNIIALIDLLPSKWSLRAPKFYLKNLIQTLSNLFISVLFNIVFLLNIAINDIIALFKACHRSFISKKKRLEWQAFHLTQKGSQLSFFSFFNIAGISSLLVTSLFLVLVIPKEPSAAAIYLLLLWFLAPFFNYIFNLKFRERETVLKERDTNRLRIIALKTWRFFKETANETTNYLPPDHFSEDKRKTATMTSTTNIGMYLLTIASAHQLGYTTRLEAISAVLKNLEILEGLDKHKGHFFNWYDVKTKNSLPPHYISTVDSGNLAVCLLTLKQSCKSLLEEKIDLCRYFDATNDYLIMLVRATDSLDLSNKQRADLLNSLRDFRETTISRLRAQSGSSRQLLASTHQVAEYLEKIKVDLQKHGGMSEGFSYWLKEAEQLTLKNQTELLAFYPWLKNNNWPDELKSLLSTLENELTLSGLRQATMTASQSDYDQTVDKEILGELRKSLSESILNIDEISKKTLIATDLSHEIAFSMDFSFLYNKNRNLFKIGYNKDRKRFDRNYYDLYASEVRLASFFALAKGDVPLDHWTTLGRPPIEYKGQLGVASWAGSMFEYFFPQIFLPNKKNTFTSQMLSTALEAHIDYGLENNIPWGVSESSFNQISSNGDYMYSIHGVPSLALRRIKKKDLITAPYATFLALEHNSKLCLSNIAKIQKIGGEGKYGFYESIDFSKDNKGQPVRVYMAHHQGAIFLALTNFLKNRYIENCFLGNGETSSLEYLIEEQSVVRGRIKKTNSVIKEVSASLENDNRPRLLEPPTYLEAPQINPIKNGKMTSFVSSRGGGFIKYDNIELTTFSYDPTLDDKGIFFYIRDNKKMVTWSAGYQPTLEKPEEYSHYFGENYAKITRIDHGTETELEVCLHPDINLEIRSLSLTNKTQFTKNLTLFSYGEVSLFTHNEMRAHPNFQKIKIVGEKYPESHSLIFKRNTSQGEGSPHFAHIVLPVSKNTNYKINLESEKENFIGKGSLQFPEAVITGDFCGSRPGIDKIFSSRACIKLLPFEKKQILYINVYSGKEDRIKQIISSLNVDTLLETLEKTSKSVALTTNICQLTSVLLYSRNTDQASIAFDKLEIDINKELPTALVDVEENFPSSYIFDLVDVFMYLLANGVEFNPIFILREKDGYSRESFNTIQQIIETRVKQERQDYSNKFIMFNFSLLKQEDFQGLLASSVIHFKHSHENIEDTIAKEFKKL